MSKTCAECSFHRVYDPYWNDEYRSCEIIPFEKLKGTIIAVFITKKGVEYQVRYYLNGEQKTEYFF